MQQKIHCEHHIVYRDVITDNGFSLYILLLIRKKSLSYTPALGEKIYTYSRLIDAVNRPSLCESRNIFLQQIN